MRKIFTLTIVITLGAALLQLNAATLDELMKQVGPTMGKLKKDLDGKMFHDAAADAEKMQSLFKDVEKFWAEKKTKDAVEFAKDAHAAAGELIKAGHAENADGASAAFAKLGKTCQGCHEVHRIKEQDGSYKIKP